MLRLGRMNENAKQVIIVRKDLKMRRGKEIAQGAHASLAAYKQVVFKYYNGWNAEDRHYQAFKAWDEGLFKKITLSVDSEAALLAIYDAAKKKDLNAVLITDSGLTEFNGIPTHTVVAIGPHWAEDIDELTFDLKLY